MPTGHYWSKNIYAVREWAIGLMKYDASHGIKTPEDVLNVEDWCRVWIENDPFDNGGDASVRRDMRAEWREVFAAYKRLRGL